MFSYYRVTWKPPLYMYCSIKSSLSIYWTRRFAFTQDDIAMHVAPRCHDQLTETKSLNIAHFGTGGGGGGGGGGQTKLLNS